MLQKILFESFQSKAQDKASHVHKKFSSSTSFNLISFSKKILYNKYSKFEYSFSLFCTNNLIFNEKCRIVARFKDFLVLDDSTEFLRRFYFKKELKNRLQKIFNFYESYCKIFPNYIILPESEFLYRNIRKKQKMIDAFNEIKKEEEENRKHLKLGLTEKKEANVVFNEKVKESIERYHPSVSNILSNTFLSDISNNLNNEIGDNDKSMITISLSSHRPLNLIDFNSNTNTNSNKEFFGFDKYFTPSKNSFEEKEKNFNDITFNSQSSILNIVKTLNSSSNNENNKNSNINNNNYISTTYNKTSKKDFKKNFSQMNKIGRKNFNNNTINNNIKSNTKKYLNINSNINNRNPNFNSVNVNSNSNKINGINHSNNKKRKSKQDNNNIIKNNKRKFISHKQTGSVPLASHMLNSHENNIIDGNTIKIINNINNIIINDGKANTIKNEMVININNNYFQLKEPKKINGKRVKSKEENKKSKTKSKDKHIEKEKEDKDDEYPQFKLFREKRTYTHYNNTQNNPKKNKKFLINEIHSPNKKKENNNNADNNKKLYKNINSNNYYTNINNNKQNNIYRNSNNCINDSKKNNKKLIESKTLNNNNSHNINHNKNITEINNNYSNILGSKFKISMNKNIKEKPKLEGVESIDQKKISINKKIVNNYLTTTQKKKTYQGRFRPNENSSLNTFNNNKHNENNIPKSEKIEVLNICNSLEAKNNPIKFKLDKKNMIRKIKTNSLQINNKNQFLSSFNLTKEKIPGTNIELDIINIEDNLFKHHKKSIKKLVNNKTQANSEAELFSGMNHRNNVYNTVHNKSIKKDKIKIINDKKNNIDINKINSTNEIKKINVKEMKEKYHKLLRGNKITHGSYDTTNRLHLLKKFRGVSNGIGNMTSSIINNTTTSKKNKRSPLGKKNILSPSERISNNLSNYIKTPIKNRLNLTNKESSIENNTFGGSKFYMLGKKNKQLDTNNKKMKFIKK